MKIQPGTACLNTLTPGTSAVIVTDANSSAMVERINDGQVVESFAINNAGTVTLAGYLCACDVKVFCVSGVVNVTTVENGAREANYSDISQVSAAIIAIPGQFRINGVPYSCDGVGFTKNSFENPVPALYHWLRSSSITGKKIAFVGDSTTYTIAITSQIQTWIATNYTNEPNSPLYGVTFQWFGANGNTLLNFNNNYPPSYGINDVIAAAPDAIILSYGINDVRLQASAPTLQQFIDRLKQAVNTLAAALPNTDILLRMPNSLLTTDVNAYGYVVPNSWAQSASDILRNAYLSLKNTWANVVVWESQPKLFPITCPASHVNMNDQLHPTIAGYQLILAEVFKYFQQPQILSKANLLDARNASYLNEFSTYPNAVLDTDNYELITAGDYVAQGSSYLRFAGDPKYVGKFRAGDIVNMNGSFAFALPAGFAATYLANNGIQLGSLGAGNPTYTQTGGIVSVYRRKYAGIYISDISKYFSRKDYPYQQRVNVSSAGSGYIRMNNVDFECLSGILNATTNDTLLHPTLGAVSLSGASIIKFYSGIQISKAGTDFTMPAASNECFVVGAGEQRADIGKTNIVQNNVTGAVTSTTYKQVTAKGAYFSTVKAALGTAGSSTTTVVVAVNGTTVLTLVFNSSATTPSTITWATSSFFITLPGDVISLAVTAGTGASDLMIALDY